MQPVVRDLPVHTEEIWPVVSDAPLWFRTLAGAYTATMGGMIRGASWWFRQSGRWSHESVIQRWGESLPAAPASPPIWIHGASLGEVRVGALFAEGLASRGCTVIASAMTEPGFQLCRDVHPDGTAIFRVPFDLPRPVRRAFSHFQPQALILVETEWWPNLLRVAVTCGVPVFVINGRLSNDAYRRYRLCAGFWRNLLGAVHFFYMRSEADSQRVVSLGVDRRRVAAAGLMKVMPYNSFPSTVEPHSDLSNGRVWVAGCTRPGEEAIVLEAFRSLSAEFNDLRLWLAPRHLERIREVAALVRRNGFEPVLWSAIGGSTADRDAVPVIVVDEAGILPDLYRLAEVAFVGGSLRPFGGHNPMEPAFAGAMVLFGPHMEEQSDAAAMLLEAGLARQVPDAQSLADAVAAFLRERPPRDLRRARADTLRARLLRVRDQVADDLLARIAAARRTAQNRSRIGS